MGRGREGNLNYKKVKLATHITTDEYKNWQTDTCSYWVAMLIVLYNIMYICLESLVGKMTTNFEEEENWWSFI